MLRRVMSGVGVAGATPLTVLALAAAAVIKRRARPLVPVTTTGRGWWGRGKFGGIRRQDRPLCRG